MPELAIMGAATRSWWVVLLRGLLAVLFGVFAFVAPGFTLTALVLVWGIFALTDGILAIAAGARARWWAVLIWGLLGVLAGLFTFFMPGITAFALLMLVAAWAIVRGAFEIVAAIRLREEIRGEWLLIVTGLASIAFGIVMMLYPGEGAIALIWLIGLHALVAGAMLIAFSFRLRSLGKRLEQIAGSE